MLYPVSWLKDYVDITMPLDALCEKLSEAGLEVESIGKTGGLATAIITVKIEKIDPHPNADKLRICQVFDGKTHRQIVTGADNIHEGQIVPASPPGAILADGTKIKKAKLRQIESNGMLCSEVELGIADSADGIWILPDETPVGVDLIAHADLQDDVIDIAILPNRGDCLSMLGLAREIAVLTGKSLRLPEFSIDINDISERMHLQLTNKDACPLYTGRHIKGAQDRPSPLWMQSRLRACGIRPISLLVDITNYVLIETGQPLHAFDRQAIAGKNITVRFSEKDEVVTTLDNEKRDLSHPTLLIADQEKVLAVAGIMGAAGSDVQVETRDLFLEAAYFKPNIVRRASSRLALRSESSIRFERGVDPDTTLMASDRAAYFYQTLAGATVEEVQITKHDAHPVFKEKTLAFRPTDINDLLGSTFSDSFIKETLEKLGFTFPNKKTVTVPSWRRHDIAEMPCLAEEVARLGGFDSIPGKLPASAIPIEAKSTMRLWQDHLGHFFRANGLTEVNTFPLVSTQTTYPEHNGGPGKAIILNNPLTPEEGSLRCAMLPSLAKVLKHNQQRQMPRVRCFEIGKIFSVIGKDSIQESMECAAMVSGPWQDHVLSKKDRDSNDITFSKLKGLVSAALNGRIPDQLSQAPCSHPTFHPRRAADLYINTQLVGHVGLLHPRTVEHYGLQGDIGYISLNLTVLAELKSETPRYQDISKFPSTHRDIALLADKNLPYGDIEAVIRNNASKWVTAIKLFDRFESETLGQDKVSFALSLTYQHPERTLSDDEVNQAQNKLLATLEKSLDIRIR